MILEAIAAALLGFVIGWAIGFKHGIELIEDEASDNGHGEVSYNKNGRVFKWKNL